MNVLIENMWFVWIAAAVFFLIAEAATTALVSIWFVPAAVLTCILSIFIDSVMVQILCFLVLSAVFMICFKDIYKYRIKKENDELSLEQRLIGKAATTSELTNGDNGRILVKDIYWQAKTVDGSIIEPNEKVIIKQINGTTILVEKG